MDSVLSVFDDRLCSVFASHASIIQWEEKGDIRFFPFLERTEHSWPADKDIVSLIPNVTISQDFPPETGDPTISASVPVRAPSLRLIFRMLLLKDVPFFYFSALKFIVNLCNKCSLSCFVFLIEFRSSLQALMCMIS